MAGQRSGGSETYRRSQPAPGGNKIAGESTPDSYQFKATVIPQALLLAQPGPVNVAGLAKIIPGWGSSSDFVQPWFATLQAEHGK